MTDLARRETPTAPRLPFFGRLSEGPRAVAAILLAMLLFALQDLTIKLIAHDISIWQLSALRSIMMGWLLAITVAFLGWREVLFPRAWAWPAFRALMLTLSYLLFYASLPFLSLSEAGATFFVGPLFITVLAALLLGEPIGPRRIAAVAIGFVGVLVIVRPGLAGFEPIALLPLGAALAYAIAVVTTRWRCPEESVFALTLVHSIVSVAVGMVGMALLPVLPIGAEARAAWPFLFEGWVPLGAVAFWMTLVTAALLMGGMLASMAAYQEGEASRIAPFEYSYLAVVPLLDLLVFAVAPDAMTLAGIALIVVSGGFVAWREGRPPRARVVPVAEDPWTPDAGDGSQGR